MNSGLTKTQFWLLVSCAYMCMLGQGFLDNTRSVTFPMMRDDLNLSYKQYGSLQSMSQFSYLVWSFSVAASLQKLGFKFVIASAFVISIIGCAITAVAKDFWMLFFFQFIACAGLGALDDAPHALASVLFKKNTGILMLLLHSCYGLGAVIGPIFAHFFEKWMPQYSFRGITMAMCVPLALMTLYICCVPFAIKKPLSDEKKESSSFTVWKALVSPMVWFQGLTLILMTTGERATSAWAGLYLEDVLHLDPAVEGAWFNSCFYIAFTVARLVGGFLVDWIGAFVTEYVIMVAAMIIFTVGLLAGKTGLYILPFAGCTVAFFWPTYICICMRYWGDNASIPVSCILPIESLIGIFIQYFLGWLNDRFGASVAYWSTVPFIGASLICVIINHLLVLKKEKKEKEESLLKNQDVVFCV